MSTYSSLLRLTLQIAGENDATWGDVANAVFQLLESAIAGLTSVSVTTADVTLSANNGSADQARAMMLEITGAPGAARNVIVPATTKVYLVNNMTTGGYTITVKTSAGTGVAIPANSPTWVYCDGTNVIAAKSASATAADTATLAADSSLLGGYAASAFARLAVANLFTKAQTVSRVTLTPGVAVSVDASLSNSFQLAVGQNFTLNNPTGGVDSQTIRIIFRQGAGGPYTITFGSAWAFPGGNIPSLTATVGAIDYLGAEYDSTSGLWLAGMNKDVKV